MALLFFIFTVNSVNGISKFKVDSIIMTLRDKLHAQKTWNSTHNLCYISHKIFHNPSLLTNGTSKYIESPCKMQEFCITPTIYLSKFCYNKDFSTDPNPSISSLIMIRNLHDNWLPAKCTVSLPHPFYR